MGAIQSALRSLRLLCRTICDLNATFAAAHARILLSPGLPVPNPTASAWQTPPNAALASLASEAPSSVDVAIIGSGITATAIAYTLLRNADLGEKKIAIVDAREICSGATGRNGGHIKESPYLDYKMLLTKLGAEAARRIVQFRMRHVDWLVDVAREEGVDEQCEVRTVETVDAFFDQSVWEDAKKWFWKFLQDFPEYAETGEWKLWESEEAREKFSLPTVLGVITYPAAALSAYALTTGLLARLASTHRNLSLHPSTPITSITSTGSHYELSTTATSGSSSITAHTVVHATNAHVSHLLPGLRGKILPVRAQMTCLTPMFSDDSSRHSVVVDPMPDPAYHPAYHPTSLPAGPSRSWSFFFAKGFNYLAVQPSGEVMLGGGWAQAAEDGLSDVGVASEAEHSTLALAHLIGLLPSVFSSLDGIRVNAKWTGCIAMSVDGLPWVGKVEEAVSGREHAGGGEWVCAGYSGEGMVNAWGCGVGCAQMLAGEEPEELPREMVISRRRIREANVEVLAEEWS